MTTPTPFSAFDAAVERVRREHMRTERWHEPGEHPPVRAGGTTCRTPDQVYAAYVPGAQHDTSRDVWREIGGFVRECVAKAPCESPATAKTRMSYASSFVAWCHLNDVPLRAEVVFTPERVEAYTIAALAGRPKRSVSVIRGALRTIGLACTKKAAWSRPVTPLRQNAYLANPYTPDEVAGFWAAADAQATKRRQHVFKTILTLGLGGGLTSAEMLDVHAHHFIDHPIIPGARVLVLPDRLVPFHHSVTPMLPELCAAQPTGKLVGGRVTNAQGVKDRVGTFRRDLDVPASLPRLSVSRLRTTWAVNVLSQPVTIAEFLAMAGTTSAKSLELYIEHVRVRDDATWMSAATGIAS